MAGTWTTSLEDRTASAGVRLEGFTLRAQREPGRPSDARLSFGDGGAQPLALGIGSIPGRVDGRTVPSRSEVLAVLAEPLLDAIGPRPLPAPNRSRGLRAGAADPRRDRPQLRLAHPALIARHTLPGTAVGHGARPRIDTHDVAIVWPDACLLPRLTRYRSGSGVAHGPPAPHRPLRFGGMGTHSASGGRLPLARCMTAAYGERLAGGSDARPTLTAAGTAPSHWRDRPAPAESRPRAPLPAASARRLAKAGRVRQRWGRLASE